MRPGTLLRKRPPLAVAVRIVFVWSAGADERRSVPDARRFRCPAFFLYSANNVNPPSTMIVWPRIMDAAGVQRK